MKKIAIAVLFIIVFLFSDLVYAEMRRTGNPQLTEKHKEQLLKSFVTPDGRFDIEVVRASGYQGALDIEGLNIALNPVTGEPIVRQNTKLSPSDHPDDIYWDNSISPSIPGVDGVVRALAVLIIS